MGTKSRVSIVSCNDYSHSEVEAAIHQCLDLLGGISQFVKPGQKVLVKPNALMGDTPEHAVTTHPTVIFAVIKEVIKAGGIALAGDSPGNASANVPKTMETTGIKQAVESAGGKMVYFQQEGIVKVKSPSNNQKIYEIPIAKPVLEADAIINLPKLKTHNLTLYTGAIKNMFGCVPGFNKTHFHVMNPRSIDLARSLVDIYEITKPTLNIMDAVVGMEGKGPAAGKPRKIGALIASTDGVALDSVCSRIIGFKPEEIHTTFFAHERNLGEMDLNKIEIVGLPLEQFKQINWKKPINLDALTRFLPPFIFSLAKPILSQLNIDPVINQNKCTKCLVCVKNCPAKTIQYDQSSKNVKINLHNCIRCFCCHELCEYRAIDLKGTWLTKLMGIS